MGISSVLLLLSVSVFYTSYLYAGVSVRGYYRSNGTYVSPHMRSSPDGHFYNNWSTAGNINPYTGKVGTKTTPSVSGYTYNYTGVKASTYPETYKTQYEVPSRQIPDQSTKMVQEEINKTNNTDARSTGEAVGNVSIASFLSSGKNEEKSIIENGISWTLLTKNKSDASYVRSGVHEYYSDGYPIISMLFTGVMKPNGRLTWLGKRFVKVKVNCSTHHVALVADAIISSDGTVVKDIVYREGDSVKWADINIFYNKDEFYKIAKVCI
ncbi:hypothetical protein [Acinetobacter sp. NRRL B-65365]|uniref:hypothetical protein n=1 Tax=Acinetobacter sp. NRRL B-65365 TaxID=1785092 RepID=UPI000B333ACE|nr:hypothetical protein [Acinetobacter sp. NRRL B-65365]